MNNQTLDEFLVERTAQKMKRIEPEINKEVAAWICEYFGSGNAADLTEDGQEAASRRLRPCHDPDGGTRPLVARLAPPALSPTPTTPFCSATTLIPAANSISSSESTKGIRISSESRLPTDDFPAPIKPTKTIDLSNL